MPCSTRLRCTDAHVGARSSAHRASPIPTPTNRIHLDLWYAQSHPDEDFAETFAEWLRPGSRWRSRYAGWPALKKIEYVDALMSELNGQTPLVRSKQRVEPLSELKITLGEFYEEKQKRYARPETTRYDADLLRLFSARGATGVVKESAAIFLRRHRREIFSLVVSFARDHAHALSVVWREMSARAAKLRLQRVRKERELVHELAVIVAMHTVAYVHEPRRMHRM
jgi:hypothetical protein